MWSQFLLAIGIYSQFMLTLRGALSVAIDILRR